MFRRFLLVLLATVSCIGLAAPVSPAATPRAPRAVLFGDSLAVEAASTWRFLLGVKGVQTETHVFGGTAPCDWLNQLEETTEQFRPNVVVFAFVGAALTPCMQGDHGEPLTPAQVGERYEATAHLASEIAGRYGASVLWTAGPRPLAAPPTYDAVVAAFRAVPPWHARTAFVDGNEMLAPNDRYAHALPCLFFEPCTGAGALVHHNIVRAPDGLHFCPAGVPSALPLVGSERCRVYSSGATRYAILLADPVLERIHR